MPIGTSILSVLTINLRIANTAKISWWRHDKNMNNRNEIKTGFSEHKSEWQRQRERDSFSHYKNISTNRFLTWLRTHAKFNVNNVYLVQPPQLFIVSHAQDVWVFVWLSLVRVERSETILQWDWPVLPVLHVNQLAWVYPFVSGKPLNRSNRCDERLPFEQKKMFVNACWVSNIRR